jgi:hypothetical protein
VLPVSISVHACAYWRKLRPVPAGNRQLARVSFCYALNFLYTSTDSIVRNSLQTSDPDEPEIHGQAMTQDQIRYDVLTQEALRGVIRKVLDEVAVGGLPGEHHFFITFDTTHPGVRLSKRMKERYPETMTIVIQHTFWNLKTSDAGFELDLTFNDIRERLAIPFAAVQAFFDPSVKFGLQFEVDLADVEAGDNTHEVIPMGNTNSARNAKPELTPVTGEDVDREQEPNDESAQMPKPASKTETGSKKKTEKSDGEKNTGEIVSLDAFRKK